MWKIGLIHFITAGALSVLTPLLIYIQTFHHGKRTLPFRGESRPYSPPRKEGREEETEKRPILSQIHPERNKIITPNH